jgi:uncharacterized membrane protein
MFSNFELELSFTMYVLRTIQHAGWDMNNHWMLVNMSDCRDLLYVWYLQIPWVLYLPSLYHTYRLCDKPVTFHFWLSCHQGTYLCLLILVCCMFIYTQKLYELISEEKHLLDSLLCLSSPVGSLAQDCFHCASLHSLGAVILASNISHARKLFV